jgi:hypothetical protein
MRMLMNNLDPDVAEKPHELVVYGGIGRAARDWEISTASSPRSRAGGDETLLVQSGKPVGVFRTHADAPRVLIANSNIVPHWATWEHFNELDRKGLMMYGQMTAGSWIYIGSQGIVQGTYETFAEAGRQHYGGRSRGQVDPDRGARRHGRRAAARRGHGRRLLLAVECQPRAHRDRCAPAMSTSRPRPRRGAGHDRALDRGRRGQVGRPARQCRRDLPELCAAASAPTSSPTRPRRTTRSTATCRAAGRSPNGGPARERPEAVEKAARASMAVHVRGDARFLETWACPRSTTATTSARWPRRRARERLRLPGLRAGLYPAAVLPRHRPVPLVRAVGRPGGHLQDRRQGEGADPRRQAPAQLARHGARAHQPSRACRRASAGSDSASATGSASPSTRWWRRAS